MLEYPSPFKSTLPSALKLFVPPYQEHNYLASKKRRNHDEQPKFNFEEDDVNLITRKLDFTSLHELGNKEEDRLFIIIYQNKWVYEVKFEHIIIIDSFLENIMIKHSTLRNTQICDDVIRVFGRRISIEEHNKSEIRKGKDIINQYKRTILIINHDLMLNVNQ